MRVATIIEKGTIRELINPRDAPWIKKKKLKNNVHMSVILMFCQKT
jgi:hypothetical protein